MAEIKIYGELKNDTQGGYVAPATQIKDVDKGKFQSDINSELEASTGLFVCIDAAGVAAKTVAATGFALKTGGAIKVTFTNATSVSGVTLNVNGTGAKPLYYNGAPATGSNSWKNGETLELYYDGTNWKANSDIRPNVIDNDKLANGAVSWGKVDHDMQTRISTHAQGCALSSEFGNSEEFGITQKTLTESRNDLQRQINEIVSGGAVVSLSASPSPVFVGTQSNISLNATTNTAATSIAIKKGGTVLATGSGASLSASDTITPATDGNTTYMAEFVIAGLTKYASRNVSAVYPIRTGSGASYVEGTALTTPKSTPAGTYNITVAANGDYVFFNVPATMTINGATMGGFTFPLEAPTNVTIGGVAYKSYQSSNTYDAGTLTIVIS